MHRLLDAAIQAGQPASLEVELDFDRVYFIESIGVVILSNLIEWLRNRKVDVSFRITDTEKDAIKYLDDIGFFRAYWGKPLSQFARLRSTTFSFEALHCSRVHQWIDGQFFPWLNEKLHCHERSLYRLKASVREIFNNISDHSEENIGCMHVQLHPAVNRVKIAISDFGIGIPTEVRKVLPHATDVQAIAWASKDGNSSKGQKNMGAGLHYLIENTLTYHKGWLGIYSGTGSLTFSHVTKVGSGALLASAYPGTLINMVLRTNELPDQDEETDNLQW